MPSNLNLLERPLDPGTVVGSFVDPELAKKTSSVFDIADKGESYSTF